MSERGGRRAEMPGPGEVVGGLAALRGSGGCMRMQASAGAGGRVVVGVIKCERYARANAGGYRVGRLAAIREGAAASAGGG